LAPDGNLEEQFQKMLTVANKWAENLRTGIISRNEAWLALQSTIMRTLVYPLPAIRLTKSRCESILASLRHFPRKLVHSTLDYIGLDIKHLFLLQEIMHIKDIILHNFNATLTGQLYRASMELFFIKLGITPSLLLTRQKAVDCLTTPSLVK